MIEWRTDFRLDIPEIDGQHLILLALINQIEINRNANTSHECLQEMVEALIAYTRFHFEAEEEIMEECGYPVLEGHRQQHESLIRQVSDLRVKVKEGSMDEVSLSLFMLNWLVDHICTSDMKLSIYIRTKELET